LRDVREYGRAHDRQNSRCGSRAIDVESVAHVPGGTEMLGGGFTHASGNPGLGVTAVILQYGG